MNPPIETSTFQLGVAPNEDPEEEGPLLEALAEEARAYVETRGWAPPVAELLLAFGVGGIIGLFLIRFTHGSRGEHGDTECWVVVGDLPSMCFETEDARTPDLALRLYCAIAQDWAENVLAGGDLSDSYPIPVEPTEEYATMLVSRIGFIRDELVPMAERRVANGGDGA